MTQQEFKAKWGALLSGESSVVDQEKAGDTLPPPLANPTTSDTKTIDDFKRDQMRRLLGREE